MGTAETLKTCGIAQKTLEKGSWVEETALKGGQAQRSQDTGQWRES